MISRLKKIPVWLWVIAAFFLLNVFTYNWYPSVWLDEVAFVDPAANLYYGHGFTSSLCVTQLLGEFWVSLPPLYSFLLYGWFESFGFGLFQVRVLDYLLWSGAVGLVCLAVQRTGWIRNPSRLALLAALLFIGDGVAFNYRSARYDSTIVFVAAACFWAFTIERPRLRMPAIVLASSFFLPTALILGPFSAAFGCLLFLFLGRKYFWELGCVAAGLTIGLCLLYLFYSELGLWHAFWHATTYISQLYYPGGTMPVWEQKLVTFPGKVFCNLSTDLFLLGLLGIILFKWGKLDSTGRRMAVFGIGTFLMIPAVSQAAYTYQIYHVWQAYIPMAICLVGAWDHSTDLLKPFYRRIFVGALILSVFATGLGAHLGLALTHLKERDYSRVEAFVRTTIHPSDVVLADYQAFYPLHQQNITAYYYPHFHALSKLEADSINCLIIDPNWLAIAKEKIGGEWQATGERYLNENQFDLALLNRLRPGYLAQQSNRKYNLAVYRRLPAPGPPPK